MARRSETRRSKRYSVYITIGCKPAAYDRVSTRNTSGASWPSFATTVSSAFCVSTAASQPGRSTMSLVTATDSEAGAHDPAYNSLYLGVLCTYLTILEVIARNVREWHFLWGASEYKRRLGGIKHDLIAVTVYRCRTAALRNVRGYLSRALLCRVRALRLAAAKVRIARAAMRRFRMVSRGIRT